jgi:transposase
VCTPSRLHLEWFPGYAPKLNPDELVWAHFKDTLANGSPKNLEKIAAVIRAPESRRPRECIGRVLYTSGRMRAALFHTKRDTTGTAE